MKRTLVLVALCACALMVVNGQQDQEEEEGDLRSPYRCPDVCAALFDPQCAVWNGRYRTFGNRCEVKRSNCKNGTRWTIVKSGACTY